MENDKNELLCVSPAKAYEAPNIPTLDDVKSNPAFLEKLPSKWKNNAKILACATIIATNAFALLGCADYEVNGDVVQPPSNGRVTVETSINETYSQSSGRTINEIISGIRGTSGEIMSWSLHDDTATNIPDRIIEEALASISAYTQAENLQIRTHGGGAASGPFYVVYLTEQETLSIILAQLEAVGLNFNDRPPDYTASYYAYVGFGYEERTDAVNLELFDAGRGVAIVNTNSRWRARDIRSSFDGQSSRNDLSVGVFYTPGLSPDREFGTNWNENFDDDWRIINPSDEELEEIKERARPILEANVTRQAQEFILWLQEQGVLG